MKNIFIILMFHPLTLSAQEPTFQGILEYSEVKGRIETRQVYYVKDHLVRMDVYDVNNELKGIRLINTRDSVVYALMPSRKLYFMIPEVREKEEEISMDRGEQARTFFDMQATAYQIENASRQRSSVVWMAGATYAFFQPMIAALGKSDSFTAALLHKDLAGALPMHITEKSASGMLLLTRTLMSITSQDLNNETFDIPADYSLMER